MDWVVFLASAGVIIAAGVGLAFCADVLAERTGLGALWFGAVVVALVTSLPELVTDVSAVRRGAPALALGDLFGSSMANRRSWRVSRSHFRPAGYYSGPLSNTS